MTTPAPTFVQAQAIVFHTLDGDVRYRVTHNPDKYADDSTVGERNMPNDDNSHGDDTPVTDEMYASGQTRVDHFYDLVRED